jgi:hypothetical protein
MHLWLLEIRNFLVQLAGMGTQMKQGFGEGPKCSVILFEQAISILVIVARPSFSSSSGIEL